jgi:hypothetical protein
MIHIKIATSCAQAHNLNANCFIVANNAFHDLILPQINRLVIVDFEKDLHVKSSMVRLPNLCLLPQVF